MKVGIDFPNISAKVGGGYTFENEVFTAFLEEAHLSTHDYTIFSNSSSVEKTISRFNLPNVHFVRYHSLNLIQRGLRRAFFLLGYIFPQLHRKNESLYRKYQIDVMLFFSPLHPALDLPYITTVWDLEHRKQPWFPEVSNMGVWYGREKGYLDTLGRASFILTGTECGKEEIMRFYTIPPDRIRVIPFPTPRFALNGINKVTTTDAVNKYGIQGEYLFYPAQFWAHKNHINLLYSLKLLHEKYGVKLSLVLVGSDKGNITHVQKVTGELGLSNYVYFLGFVSQEEVIDLYKSALALIFVSFFGPDNLPPLEAFALGCPVVAAHISGSDELLGDAALCVDPKNPEEIAHAVYLLYSDKQLRNQLIQKGFLRAVEWKGDDYIRAIFSLLDEFEHIRRCWDRS